MTTIKVQEVTEWPDATPNHIYILTKDRSRMVGYIPAGTTTQTTFSRPLKFDARYRKFKTLA